MNGAWFVLADSFDGTPPHDFAFGWGLYDEAVVEIMLRAGEAVQRQWIPLRDRVRYPYAVVSDFNADGVHEIVIASESDFERRGRVLIVELKARSGP